jgi:hypothetical protein
MSLFIVIKYLLYVYLTSIIHQIYFKGNNFTEGEFLDCIYRSLGYGHGKDNVDIIKTNSYKYFKTDSVINKLNATKVAEAIEKNI